MGKIVKHCVACDESFAEKFGYCPNCGDPLQAFELNPLADKAAIKEDNTPKAVSFETKAFAPDSTEKAPVVEPATVADSMVFSTNGKSAHTETSDADEFEDFQAEEPAADAFGAAPVAGTNGNGNGHQEYQTASYDFQTTASKANLPDDDGFHVTVIEEKNLKQRNLLLLGSLLLMTTLALGGIVYSIFNQSLLVGAIDEGNPLYIGIVDETPMDVEKPEKPKNNKDAGGGGGGGREKPTPTSQGQLATQTEKPLIAPTVTLVKKDFDLKYQASTQGKTQIKQTDQPYGDPNSKYSLPSDGMGSGGGQGSGIGTGQGSGRGTGAGSGIGSGLGGGDGDGVGNGKGSGRQGAAPPPPPIIPVGPTTAVSIISKPRPNYTDAARQNQVTGTVTLRVTFNANGQIGGISPVSGLPHGLTEQAIAAARGIKFEPAKKNGVPQTVTKQIQYSFTIY